MSDKYSAPQELPRFPTIIRDAANAAAMAADEEPQMPVERGAPPPKFPSMVDVGLPRAEAVAAANRADGFSPDGGNRIGEGLMKRVDSKEIDESLRKNAVDAGTGERKAREAGEKVWKQEDQEQFDKLLEERVQVAEEDSSWIGGGKGLMTRVESEVVEEKGHEDEHRDDDDDDVTVEDSDETVEDSDELGADDDVQVDSSEENVDDDTSNDVDEARAKLAPAGSTATDAGISGAPMASRLVSPGSIADRDLVKRNSLAGGVAPPVGNVRTDETVSGGDASWIGGGLALTKAQKAEKEAERASFESPQLTSREVREDEEKPVVDDSDDGESAVQNSLVAGEIINEEVDEEADDDKPAWARKRVGAAGAGLVGGAAALGATTGSGDAPKRESFSADVGQDDEPEWVKKSRELKASSGAAHSMNPEDDERPDWAKSPPSLAPSGAVSTGELASAPEPVSAADAAVTETSSRAADIGNPYTGDRIDSDVVAASADAGTTFDRRESAGMPAAPVVAAGSYSAMRDSGSYRSSTDSYATATGSALGTGAPPSSTANRTLLSGTSYSDLGSDSRVTSVAQTDFTAPDGASPPHDDLTFSRPTSAPPPPEESDISSRDYAPAVGAAALGGAAVAGGAAAVATSADTVKDTAIPSSRAKQVTSVPVIPSQSRPVLSGEWAGAGQDEADPDDDVARRHEALMAADPGINGAHVNVTRDFGLFGGHTDGVNDAAFVNSDTLLTAGEDGKVCVWDINGKYAKSEFIPYEGRPVKMLHVLPPDEDTASWTIMTMSDTRLMRIWNTTLERAVLLHSTQIPPADNDLLISIPVISAKRRARATRAANDAAAASQAGDSGIIPNGTDASGKPEKKEGGGVFGGTLGLFGRRKDAVPA